MLQFFPYEMTPATLRSYGEGEYADGYWAPGEVTESEILIVKPQPVRREDLINLEDGESVSDYAKTWTKTTLKTRRGQADADEIEIAGYVFKVVQVDDRSMDGDFFRVVMRRPTP